MTADRIPIAATKWLVPCGCIPPCELMLSRPAGSAVLEVSHWALDGHPTFESLI